MSRNDGHPRRASGTHRCLFTLILTACFHTEYLHEDAGAGDADAGTDVDASAGPDAARCPASYDLPLPGPSRYRLIPIAARAWEHSDACANDGPGTHLVILETAAEVDSIQALLQQPPTPIMADGVWVGGVQLNTATKNDEAWLGFDGHPLLVDWYMGDYIEPNNGGVDMDADKHVEQFASIVTGKYPGLNDSDGTMSTKGALCECDGQPMADSAAAAVDSYRAP